MSVCASMQICMAFLYREEMTTEWVQLQLFLCIHNCLGKCV